MVKIFLIKCIVVCVISCMVIHAQSKTSILIQSTHEDEQVYVSIDKSLYFPGDTIALEIHRYDNTTTASVIPLIGIEGVRVRATGLHTYYAVIPKTVTPGLYPIKLKVTDTNGRRF